MSITHNLPIPNYHKSNHQHLAHHLTQLKMDPTLCSKGSPTTKYFSSPEPSAQELCKITCYWKQALGSPLSMDIKPYKNLQTTYYYTDNLGIQHESPSLHRTILTYKLPPSSPSTHLSCSYKISLIHPLGSLMPAAWLQGYPDSILPFLGPNSQSPLQLWNFRSPKFGFKIASSLATDGNTMMYHFHHQYLPEGMTNISPEELKTLTKTLETTYSDDVPNPITLTRIKMTTSQQSHKTNTSTKITYTEGTRDSIYKQQTPQ